MTSKLKNDSGTLRVRVTPDEVRDRYAPPDVYLWQVENYDIMWTVTISKALSTNKVIGNSQYLLISPNNADGSVGCSFVVLREIDSNSTVSPDLCTSLS